MKNRFLVVFPIACMLFQQSTYGMDVTTSNDLKVRMGWAAGSLLAAAGTSWLTTSLGKSTIGRTIADTTGYDHQDLAAIVGATGALYSIGCVAGDDAWQSYALRMPLAALVGSIAMTKSCSQIINHMPIIGNYFTCTNESCKGYCKNCKLRSIVRAIGLYSACHYAFAAWQDYQQSK